VKFQHIAKINDKNIGNKIARLSRSSVCLEPEDFPGKADNKSANLSESSTNEQKDIATDTGQPLKWQKVLKSHGEKAQLEKFKQTSMRGSIASIRRKSKFIPRTSKLFITNP
jgi:hypothetical protein